MRFFTLLAFCLITTLLQAQETEEQYLQAAAEHTCECVTTDEDDDASSLQVKLGTCMVRFMLDDTPRYERLFGKLDLNDQSSMVRIGERLGVVMLSVCPDMMMRLVEGGQPEEEPVDEVSVTGRISGISNDRLASLKVKPENGPEMKLLWLEYFEGEELLQSSDVTSARYRAFYEVREIFNGKTETYEPSRVIVRLERVE